MGHPVLGKGSLTVWRPPSVLDGTPCVPSSARLVSLPFAYKKRMSIPIYKGGKKGQEVWHIMYVKTWRKKKSFSCFTVFFGGGKEFFTFFHATQQLIFVERLSSSLPPSLPLQHEKLHYPTNGGDLSNASEASLRQKKKEKSMKTRSLTSQHLHAHHDDTWMLLPTTSSAELVGQEREQNRGGRSGRPPSLDKVPQQQFAAQPMLASLGARSRWRQWW